MPETDIDVMRAMLTRAGVVFTEMPRTNNPESFYIADVPDGITINVEESAGPRNYGYCSFVAEFYFDQQGALFGVGVWE